MRMTIEADDFRSLEALANAASKGGDHIYTHPRDDNNWQANDAFSKGATPEVVLELIRRASDAERPVPDASVLPEGWCTMGVGDGSGTLFVHGSHDAIQACQRRLLAAEDNKAGAILPRGYTAVRTQAIRWLLGERGNFECPPSSYFRGRPMPYFWRKNLREACLVVEPGATIIPLQSEDDDNDAARWRALVDAVETGGLTIPMEDGHKVTIKLGKGNLKDGVDKAIAAEKEPQSWL